MKLVRGCAVGQVRPRGRPRYVRADDALQRDGLVYAPGARDVPAIVAQARVMSGSDGTAFARTTSE